MFEKKKRAMVRPIRPTNPGIFNCAVQASVLTDKGPRRESNEDCGKVIWPQDPQRLVSHGVLAIVADGMGGHEGGEVASHMAVHTVSEAYSAARTDPQTALVQAFQTANREIYALSRQRSELTGMGTTCTAVAVVNGTAYSAHVGDSRAYLVRGGQIYRMTEDHSATMALVKQGLITMHEAREHEERNVILRAMGTHPEVEVATWDAPFVLWPEDRIVLCSDGLHDIVTDPEICFITGSTEPSEASSRLLNLALERMCTDNVTVAVLRVYEHGLSNGAGSKATREVDSL
ncbi:MAG TPA: PP2C family serine/threonine-protein phosphatase [Bryobacteraceae bacterium]|nr:PP2C family serine/threonine-protein phosphatase [Bryobacteraceae bacterium]